jgi:hypothetical protein
MGRQAMNGLKILSWSLDAATARLTLLHGN